VNAGMAALLFDLLTPYEAADRRNVFDIGLLARRVMEATQWMRNDPQTMGMPVGYFGASTGAAAALVAAAELGDQIKAVVSRGGRPDLAGDALARVTAPTLLLVGSLDEEVLELNRLAQQRLQCFNELIIVSGAGHLFEEPGMLEQVSAHVAEWFAQRL
jgi:putative phosphoribosyl transferase